MENNTKVKLDKNLYNELLDSNMAELRFLKEDKNKQKSVILENKEKRDSLKKELKLLKKKLKTVKNELSFEKKELKEINDELITVSHEIVDLINSPKDVYGELLEKEQKNYIDLKMIEKIELGEMEKIVLNIKSLNDKVFDLKNKIKYYNRSLKNDKKTLQQTNKKIIIIKNVITDLVDIYTEKDQEYINLEKYKTMTYEKRRK